VARAAIPASSAAAMPEFMIQQDKRPVLNGRPIGLFEPVYNTFDDLMRSHERIDADADMYSSVKQLFKVFAAIYDTVGARLTAVKEQLTAALGKGFDEISALGVKSDGVMIQPCGPSRGYLLILEVKNEIGTGSSDPYNQSSIAYRKYWVNESRKSDQFAFIITSLIHTY
jgi:hypothetical protein